MLLPKGEAVLDGNELKILAVPQWLFDRNVVLRGALVRAEVVAHDKSLIIAGLVYFYDGLWLGNVANAGSTDVIELLDGSTSRGRITSRTDDGFVVQHNNGRTDNVAFANIKSITSPRAFTFNIPSSTGKPLTPDMNISFNSNMITLVPSKQRRLSPGTIRAASVPASNLTGTEKGISNHAIAAFIALDVLNEIAPAIAIPLVINKHNTQAGQNALSKVALSQPPVPVSPAF